MARSWLLARIAGHLDVARNRVPALLELGDDDLIAELAGRDEAAVRAELDAFDADGYRTRCTEVGLELMCRCDPGYPASLWSLPAEPAVLHVAGGTGRLRDLVEGHVVAIIGARRASPYALENARSLARGIARANVTVVSGMAAGVDSAAHEGTLEASGRTIAVLPSAPQRAYPAAARSLYRRILTAGVAVSELGPDVPVRRWMFHARNRIVAALCAMTVVVAARQGSGALTTAGLACTLKRELGAVPGQITSPLAWGPHQLIKTGARLVTETSDILIPAFGMAPLRDFTPPPRLLVPSHLQPLFDALADGLDPPQAFDEAGLDAEEGLTQLAVLELGGHIRRQPGGRFSIAG
ncbi:MAG TPA: DNA-processing protein DprA [Solirubrobacteraceae bacterium]|nr:DNA-processing protein DprA [Solirubrobacteraceae bacterium]